MLFFFTLQNGSKIHYVLDALQACNFKGNILLYTVLRDINFLSSRAKQLQNVNIFKSKKEFLYVQAIVVCS